MQSMDEIYREYADLVYRFALARVRDEDIAEEITQETFFQAIRSSDRFDGSCKISTWLCAIAKNQILVYLRKNPEKDQLRDADIGGTSTSSVNYHFGKSEILWTNRRTGLELLSIGERKNCERRDKFS